MRLQINIASDRARVAQEILAMPFTHPLEVVVRRAVKRLTGAKQAKIHIVLRQAARHFGYSERAMKALAKRGDLDDVDWPRQSEEGGLGAIDEPMDTMDLPDREAEVLLIQLEAWAANAGVPVDTHETMEEYG